MILSAEKNSESFLKIFKNRVENLDLIAHKLEVRKIAQNVEDEDLPEGEE